MGLEVLSGTSRSFALRQGKPRSASRPKGRGVYALSLPWSNLGVVRFAASALDLDLEVIASGHAIPLAIAIGISLGSSGFTTPHVSS